MAATPKETLINMKYTGPKARKHLDLPLGVHSRGEWTHQVIFAPNNGMIGAVPAQFVETLLTLPEHYQYADDAARHAYASWLTDSSSGIPAPLRAEVPAASSPPKKKDDDVVVVPNPDKRPVNRPNLEHFEEFV